MVTIKYSVTHHTNGHGNVSVDILTQVSDYKTTQSHPVLSQNSIKDVSKTLPQVASLLQHFTKDV